MSVEVFRKHIRGDYLESLMLGYTLQNIISTVNTKRSGSYENILVLKHVNEENGLFNFIDIELKIDSNNLTISARDRVAEILKEVNKNDMVTREITEKLMKIGAENIKRINITEPSTKHFVKTFVDSVYKPDLIWMDLFEMKCKVIIDAFRNLGFKEGEIDILEIKKSLYETYAIYVVNSIEELSVRITNLRQDIEKKRQHVEKDMNKDVREERSKISNKILKIKNSSILNLIYISSENKARIARLEKDDRYWQNIEKENNKKRDENQRVKSLKEEERDCILNLQDGLMYDITNKYFLSSNNKSLYSRFSDVLMSNENRIGNMDVVNQVSLRMHVITMIKIIQTGYLNDVFITATEGLKKSIHNLIDRNANPLEISNEVQFLLKENKITENSIFYKKVMSLVKSALETTNL